MEVVHMKPVRNNSFISWGAAPFVIKQRLALRVIIHPFKKYGPPLFFCAFCLSFLRTGVVPDSLIIHPALNIAGYFTPLDVFHF
jgi:hypothetical protein